MVTLFMTVGTGHIDPRTARPSISHALAFAIDRHRPERVVFFGSDQSRATVAGIEAEYREATGEEVPPYEFVEIRDIDNIATCIEVMDRSVREQEGKRLIDYTSGTKSMTAAAAIVATLHHIPIYIVEATRGKDGIGMSGTERVREQTLFPAYDHILSEKALDEFNAYRFESAIRTLEETVALPEREHYLAIFRGYAAWDLFDHAGAFAILSDLKDERIGMNKGFLGALVNMGDQKQQTAMRLADLVANAARRIEEHKYDDATARFYRAVELIAQIRLLDYGVDDINRGMRVDDLKKFLSPADFGEYCRRAGNSGVLHIGVREKYTLLQKMGWTDAEKEYGTVRDLLTKRNTSILAHGLTPVDGDFVKGLYDCVVVLAESVCGPVEFRKRMEIATFARL
jgi:CRISPR-associated protein (TIGR02710 family)